MTFIVDTSAIYYVHAFDGTCAVESGPIEINAPGLDLGEDIYVCTGADYQVSEMQVSDAFAGIPGISFLWSDGATSARPAFSDPTTPNPANYSVTVTYSNSAGSTCTALTDNFQIYRVECCENSAIILHNPTLTELNTATSNLPASDNGTIEIDGYTIDINGRLLINNNNLRLVNCTLHMAEAAEIIVSRHLVLTLDGTIIQACGDKMWKGIRLLESATIKDQNNPSEINDAEYGILTSYRSRVYLDDFDAGATTFTPYLTMRRNYVSLYVPPAPANLNINDNDVRLGNMLIKSDGVLKDLYIDQLTPVIAGGKSYAGMVINDLAGVIGNGTGIIRRIKFEEMNNGIITLNSSIEIKNSSFSNIKNLDGYSMPMNALNGTAIYAGANYGKYGILKQTGLGNGVSAALTFNECDYGIHASHVSTYISENKMDEIRWTGIRCENTARFTVQILNNQISTYSIGIYLAHNRNSNNFEIGGNHIFWGTLNQISQPGLCGILYDAAAHYFPNSNDHKIICNTVSGDFVTGMQLSDMISNAEVTTNSIDMSSDYMTTGIGIINNFQSKFNSNSVTGDNTTIGSAYQFMLNDNIEVSDNFSYKTAIGFDFSGPNNDTKLYTNNIGLPCFQCTTGVTNAHNIGLHLDQFGVIGEQFITGPSSVTVFENLWAEDPGQTSNVYTSTNGAVDENPNQNSCITSQFKYPSTSTQGSADSPFNTCSGTGNWFLPATNPTLLTQNYTDDCSSYQRIADEYISMLDQYIALDSTFTESLSSEIKYIMKSVLMDKLLANDSLAGDSLMGAFLSSQINTTLGKLAIERSFIDHLFDDDPDLVSLLYQNDSIIRSLLQKKSTLDSLIYGEAEIIDSLAAVEESVIVLSQLSELTVKQNEILGELNTFTQTRIDSALSSNNSISVSIAMEENEKKVNAIYLEKIVVGDLNLDSTQLADLDFIATQCPFYGGKAVIRAREIKRMLGDTTQYNDQYFCDTTNGSRIGHFNKSRIYQPWIRVMPNPAQESLVFEYELPRDMPAKIIIFDTLGKIIDELVVSANSNRIQFNASLLQNDIYLYRLQVDDGSVSNGKMVIVK